MQPGIDLEIAILFRGEAQFHAAISTDKSILAESSAIFHSQVQEPFVCRTPADFATLFVHRRADTRALDAYIIDRGGEGVLENFLQASGCPRFGLYSTPNQQIRRHPELWAASVWADLDGLNRLGPDQRDFSASWMTI
jgi:hypothetical protein